MIKRILFGTGLILFMLLDTSCKKWLDLQPIDGITRQEFWRTEEDLAAALNGCYSSMVGPPPGVKADAADGGGRPLSTTIFLWGEVRGDMVVPNDLATAEQVDIKDMVNVNTVSTSRLVTWAGLYRTINYCNTVIEFAPTVKQNDPTMTDAKYNSYVGEALAIRSLMYFYLARTFRDVPLKLKATSKDSDVSEIGKANHTEVLNQIVADLKQAEPMVPLKHSADPAVNKSRITRLAINALLADVYLWMEKYDECIAECDKVLSYSVSNPSELSVIPASSTWWTEVFQKGFSREAIFELAHKYNNTNVYVNSYGAFINFRFKASPVLTSDFFPSDPSTDFGFDVREFEYFGSSTGLIFKFLNSQTEVYNFPVYRLPDVLLMKAEALAYSDRGAEALDDIIKPFRLIREAVKSSQQTPDPTDKDGVGEYVLAERGRELAFEGKRWFDLLRYAKRDNYAHLSILLNVLTQTVAPANQQSAIGKYRDYNSHYLPINQADIFADTKLVQNPFYER
ncbi:MAG: RagB/SusD family nutrient uptake outer membrane protein [Sphingobacteriaceae bacterium]|nr:RagB/SusD family nutrient uptake outer membrane protein [Sphingobacteriaceae bacterium]